jgi:hypothetical protein
LAFVLGQRNVNATGLAERDGDGNKIISPTLRDAEEFIRAFLSTEEFGDKLADRLLNTDVFVEEWLKEFATPKSKGADAKDLSARVAELEHALSEEMAWSAYLEDQRDALANQLNQLGHPKPLIAGIREALADRKKP